MPDPLPRRAVRVVPWLLIAAVLSAAPACSDDTGSSTASTAPPTTPDASESEATETSEPSASTSTTAAPPKAPAEVPARLSADADLYAVPDPIPDLPHGTLLRYQPVTSSVDGGSLWRIMYMSESVAGDPIVVTGLAMVPDAPAPDGGRVTLTVAHGTTGVADECSPSMAPDQGEALLFDSAVQRGWITAISDYEGLGTPGRHPYLVGPSEGRGVLDTALAAQSLPDADASDQALIAGYSQGGHGAAWANELAADWAPELDVVGTFAGAPASELDLILDAAAGTPAIGGFALMMIAGFEQSYPHLDLSEVLTPEGEETLGAVDKGCTGDVFEATENALGPLVQPDAGASASWKRVLARSNPGHTATDVPVLIVHSAADDLVPALLSELMAARMCESGQVVERRVREDGLGHSEAAAPAYVEAMAWFDGLLAGEQPLDTC